MNKWATLAAVEAQRDEALDEVVRLGALALRRGQEIQRLREILAVFADEMKWERRRENEPPVWDGDGDPVIIAHEALSGGGATGQGSAPDEL